jgi:ABC-type ATPase with predicted acetyltransferase domain
VVAVDNISTIIEDRQFVVLVGPSGCGTTTTLRVEMRTEIAKLHERLNATIVYVTHGKPVDAIITANVEVTEPMGAEIYVYIDIDGVLVTARVNPRSAARVGHHTDSKYPHI